jgi:hypothetical protein
MNDNPETAEPAPRDKILDFEKFLPFGETLRGYLEQSFVKTTDLSDLLRSRGVFVQGAQKEDLIPILTATLISPSEFQTLLDCRKERDSKEKTIDRTRAWKSDRSLLEAANAAVQLDKLDFESTEKCKLLGKPTISSINGDSEHIELNFTVRRTRVALDWSNEESLFAGKVTLKKVKVAGQVVLTITHTSPETKDVAEKYAKLIEESLRNSDDIGEPTADDQILYSSFDNTQRADFLLSLTGECSHDELEFVQLTNLEALTDRTNTIPDNCKELIEGFEQLRLKGELHKSAYCRRREIYPFVRFYRMDARFKFKVIGAEGECNIRYEFAEYGTSQSKKAEFTHEVEISHLADKFKHVHKGVVKQPLQELVSRVVAKKFKERNKGNKSTPAATTRSRPPKRRVAAPPAAGTTVTPSALAQDLPFPPGF